MMKSNNNNQRGFSFLGFFFVVAVVISAVIVGLKLIPAYIQNVEINQIFNQIVSDPAMTSASSNEIRQSFSKRAYLERITVISAEDIEIEKGEVPLRLSASYSVKIPLIANITLLLDFNPSSS
ncbi:MAG: DUF4845 domain-containing protein [Sideroxydans sp.]|nr:DUF4845 domain-containing protein [Sideroxydans sp.]